MTKICIKNHRNLLLSLALPFTLAVASSACVAGEEDLSAKPEPTAEAESAVAHPCGVRNGKLWCTNKYKAPIYWGPEYQSGWRDELWTTYSWFDCYTFSDLHEGGNTTWYHTTGDKHGLEGFTAAVNLSTSSAFDADPGAQGLRECTFP